MSPIGGQTRQPCRSRIRRGFSLIELVVIVVIIAALAGIALPRVANSIALQRVQGAARRITRDLALAQQRARLSSASQAVQFDVGDNSYELVGMQHLDRTTEPYVVSLSAEPYCGTILAADFDGDTSIVFDGYGTADSGGTVVIKVGPYQRTVSVDPDTGQASAQ